MEDVADTDAVREMVEVSEIVTEMLGVMDAVDVLEEWKEGDGVLLLDSVTEGEGEEEKEGEGDTQGGK